MATKDDDFESLLEHIRSARGFDFTGYKPASLQRRLRKRMDAIAIDTYEGYRDLLEVDPEEYHALFDILLINVTSFFRDEDTWKALEQQVIPQLLETRDDQAQIRVWSAGCASG